MRHNQAFYANSGDVVATNKQELLNSSTSGNDSAGFILVNVET